MACYSVKLLNELFLFSNPIIYRDTYRNTEGLFGEFNKKIHDFYSGRVTLRDFEKYINNEEITNNKDRITVCALHQIVFENGGLPKDKKKIASQKNVELINFFFDANIVNKILMEKYYIFLRDFKFGRILAVISDDKFPLNKRH